MPLFSTAASFNPSKDIPSLKDKVILITGANSGLGKSSALEFARHGPARIFVAARSVEKANAAIADIKKAVPDAPPLEPLELDLASFDSVKSAAKAVTAQSQRLDILMLNAGIMAVPHGLTKDGYEIQFGTNHMGHALLTKLLLPTLLRTAEQHNPDVRVVVLSSGTISMAPPAGINFADCKTSATGMGTPSLYGQSKLANALFAQELARQHPTLKVASIHPGVVATNLLGPLIERFRLLNLLRPIVPLLIAGPDKGARNQLWAAVAKEVVSGEFYTPVGIVGTIKGTDKVRDKELAKQLWEWTEKELSEHEL